jgi:NTE family protein
MESTQWPQRPTDKRVALVLQGGGALGAYQAGVFQALDEHGFCPDWVAGTSIGAINSAIVAGNAPENRVARLREFWETVAQEDFWGVARMPDAARQAYSSWSALGAMVAGRPDFFVPRPFNPQAAFPVGSAETASYYDTAPLRGLLERLIDFDLLNGGSVRLSVGAVNVTTGTQRYFDTKVDRICPEHIMASGALPPGFPAVRVEGELYWDGGIYSNTPLEIVLDDLPRHDTLCFMIALFNPAGPEPRSLAEVESRRKDITYASRAREHIEAFSGTHNLRRAVRALYKALPEELRQEPEFRALADLGCYTTMHIVQLIYPTRPWESAFKDVDFSRASIEDRWALGHRDASRMLRQSPWLEPVSRHTGVVVLDLPPESE